MADATFLGLIYEAVEKSTRRQAYRLVFVAAQVGVVL